MTRLVHVQDSLPDSARLSHKNFRAKFLHFAYSNANAEVRGSAISHPVHSYQQAKDSEGSCSQKLMVMGRVHFGLLL